MRIFGLATAGFAAIAVSACSFSVGTQTAASLSCQEIADRAKEISQTPGNTPVTGITNVQEVSATATERRCTGTATTADGSGEVYIRGIDRDGTARVELSSTPFE